MSSLLLLNGSPRGPKSNSMKMLAHIADGWQRAGGDAPEILHLSRRADFDRAVEAFAETDAVLLGMPLYADAMPALVKEYFEALAPYVGRTGNPTMAFVVQSGFTEATHSRLLERYLEKLAGRLDAPYAGTVVRGGGEALRTMPDEANKKLWARLESLGASLALDGRFDAETLSAVAGIERFSPVMAGMLSVALKWPLPEIMWNSEIRKNGAYARRFATPYAPDAP